MSLEIDVLRSLLHITHRGDAPTLAQLTESVGADDAAVRRALHALAHNGLVQRTPGGLRLSLAGLAVAVAFAEGPAPAIPNAPKKSRRRSSSLSLIRPHRAPRHRAA
jgi:hypothetical protein